MHTHPLVFLGCFVVIVPVIYISVAILIDLMRPAAKNHHWGEHVDP